MTFSFLVAHVHSHTLQYYYTHAGVNFSQAVRNHVPAPRWKEQYEDGEVVIRTYSFKTENLRGGERAYSLFFLTWPLSYA